MFIIYFQYIRKISLFVLVGFFPTIIASQEAEPPRAATITVGGLDVAMFSNDDSLSVFFGSQAKLLQALDAAGEIHTVPTRSFLIFFVGKDVFSDNTLSKDFSHFVGDSILRKLHEIPQPTSPCSSTIISFLNGTDGLVVFLDTSVVEPVAAEKCVVGGFIEAWAGEHEPQDSAYLSDLVVSLIGLVRGQE